MTIPYVGAHTWNGDSKQTLFGYIFGENKESGEEFNLAKAHYLATHPEVTDVEFTTYGIRATSQYYSDAKVATQFYIPMSLLTVNIYEDTVIGYEYKGYQKC